MSVVKVIGIDLGKSTFHLSGHDHAGREVFRHKFSRAKLISFLSNFPSTLIAMEACCGSNWLARKCIQMGHQAKLIPAQYVNPTLRHIKMTL